MLPLKRLTDQAEHDAENQQGERPRGRSDQKGLRGGLAAFYVAASVETADDPGKSLSRDRDLVWRRTDTDKVVFARLPAGNGCG